MSCHTKEKKLHNADNAEVHWDSIAMQPSANHVGMHRSQDAANTMSYGNLTLT